ncbi:O-antigen ligase family protein [Caulobacter soli]|uniref:O-antigen ligase family protein n=1 Tax=Caulobacter soli TaxID=2708539 RepID=UPI0013E9C2C9|nr:O-antigen ligase family protein [Caulobacter soli]
MAVLAFGASDLGTATLFTGLYALFLIGLLTTCAWARRDLARQKGLKTTGGLFLLLLVVVLLPLTPWGPGGSNVVWTYLPEASPKMGGLAIDRSAVILNVVQFLGLACLFLTGRVIGASESRARWFLRASVLATGLYAAAAFADYVGVRRTARLVATLLSPNSAATLFGSGMLMAMAFAAQRLRRGIGLAVLRRGDPEAILAMAVASVLLVNLLLTASRGGVVATLICVALFLAWEGLSQRHRMRTTAVLAVIAMVIVVGAVALRSFEIVAERFSLAEQDAGIRAAIFAPHWDAFRSAPWFGFGLGSFPTVNQLIVTQANLPALFNVRAVHNLYLQWLEEAGVVGALAMTALFVALIWPILRGGFREGAVGIWCRGAVCAALLFLIHGSTDFALQVPAIQALAALILGVVGGMAAPQSNSRTVRIQPVWPTWAAGGAAAVVTLIAASLALPMLAGKLGGDLSAWPSAPADALAGGIEARLVQPGMTAERGLALERLSARELSLRPASGSAWLRRAAIYRALGRDDAANFALERSFAVAPLQTSLFERRTALAYESWDRLSPLAREQEIYQFGVEWRRLRNPRHFIALANSLHNPTGRVGMALQITVQRMTPFDPIT